MSRRAKEGPGARIDTAGDAPLGQNPFAGLELSGLPPGPDAAASPVSDAAPARRGRVVLRRETAHRGGKTVVIAGGFDPAPPADGIEELARGLRRACGCGGTVREGEIEIQGDQCARVAAFLEAKGFRVAGVRA